MDFKPEKNRHPEIPVWGTHSKFHRFDIMVFRDRLFSIGGLQIISSSLLTKFLLNCKSNEQEQSINYPEGLENSGIITHDLNQNYFSLVQVNYAAGM